MKRITLKKGLTMALLVLVGSVYSQVTPAVDNTIRLRSLGAATTTISGGSEGNSVASDKSTLNIGSSDGAITYVNDTAQPTTGADYTIVTTATAGNNTGNVKLGTILGQNLSIILKAGANINQTTGEVTVAGGINRGSDGLLGVRKINAGSNELYGIDAGEGLVFGFDLSNLNASVGLQVTKITFGTFSGTNETAVIMNRQDPSKFLNVSQATNGSNPTIDVTSLNLILTGGSPESDILSVFNNTSASASPLVVWGVSEIQFKLVAFSTVWNGTSWSNFTPGPAVDATIEGFYSALARGGFSAKTLTVNSGSLTLEATKSVKIENGVTNNAGPSGIIVENGGALIQVINSANANVGAITVNRNSNSLLRLDYTMWSSPVSGTQTLAQFSPLTSQSPNRFYTYDSATDLYANVPPSTIFDASNAGKGYLIRMPNDASAVTATPFAGVFTGVPNSGPITLSGLTANKYYSAGNPYPSVLDAALFLAGNPNAVGTLYFWRKTNGTANTFVDGTSTGTAYATWTGAGGTASSSVTPNNIVPSANIAVGQGFIVNTGTATSLNFTNTMRPNSSTATFLKTKAAATPDRVWLNLTNATGAFSQALIAYMDGATTGVDNGIDGEYINDSSLALTSNINNKEYTIQGRPAFDASDVVALNFKTDLAGDYTIALDHFDGLFATGQAVYLADSKTGSETDLKAGPYNFTAAVGVDNNRFTLKYQKTLKVIDSDFNDNSVTMYAKNGTLYVNSGASAISNIKVFDIQGRLVAEQRNVKANTATISNLSANQALIVQVSSEDNTVVSKKVLN